MKKLSTSQNTLKIHIKGIERQIKFLTKKKIKLSNVLEFLKECEK